MKKICLSLFLITIISVALHAQQRINGCGYKIPPRSFTTKFQSVYEARDVVQQMLDTIKWQQNFTLQEKNGIQNAYATIINSKRWIVYDNTFLEDIDEYAKTKWASLSIMAHEMGHHYYNHVVSGSGSTIPKEIEADAFSGYVMARMGASKDQSVAAIKTIATDQASSTHPGKADRVDAISRGWDKGYQDRMTKNNTTTNTGTNTPTTPPVTVPTNPVPNPNPTQEVDASWIGLTMQSSKDETVLLSDDGKNYQQAVIKAGQAFVFKYEIYNYGYLKLRYFNGYRTFKLNHGSDYSILWNRRTNNWTVVQITD